MQASLFPATLTSLVKYSLQPQGQVQVLLNVLRGFTAQAALDAPRFCIDAEPIGEELGGARSKVYLEEGISEEVAQKLRGKPSRLILDFY